MRNLTLPVFILIVCLLPSVAESSTSEAKTEMTYCTMKDQPAEISELSPAGRYSATVAIKNSGSYGKIVAYKIGFFSAADKRHRKYGLRVRLGRPLLYGETGPRVVEGVREWKGKAPDKIIFFVAEVHFVDHTGWLAELSHGGENFVCVEHDLARIDNPN